MPFLKTIINFTNFLRINQDKFHFKIIFGVFIFIILCFIGNKNIRIIENLSFDKIIPDCFLNLIYIHQN